jgi:glycosyltransferase involved in cell wall biosynthesis
VGPEDEAVAAANAAALLARPSICLCMIVRDEGVILAETLAALRPHIDTWVIVDTGSGDDTIDVVRRTMAELDVPGELHERKWKDFGTNRTEALELCAGRADYAWVMDADDRVVGPLNLGNLTADVYRLRMGTDLVEWRPRLFTLTKRWAYDSVVHEDVRCVDEPHTEQRLLGDYHVESRWLGNRNKLVDKRLRDAELLREALREDPDDPRYVFDLAQSLFAAGQLTGALQQYKRRLEIGGSEEETFVAKLQRARCLDRLGDSWDTVLAGYLDASRARPARAEPLYEIARHYRGTGEFELAYRFASAAADLEVPTDDDALFVANDIYEWRARDELAIAAFYLGRRAESFELSARVLDRTIPDAERTRVEANLPFGLPAIVPERVRFPAAIVDDLASATAPSAAEPQVTLTMTTGRRRWLFEQAMNSFLHCCTDRELVDRWIVLDDGSSDDDLEAMRTRYPFVEVVSASPAGRGDAARMNQLVELVDTPYWLHLDDGWLFLLPDRYVSSALDVFAIESAVSQVLFNRNYADTLDDAGILGGEPRRTFDGTRYRMHKFSPPGSPEYEAMVSHLPPGGRSNLHWPHFAIRPSVIRTATMKSLDPFDDGDPSFEATFSRLYSAAGHRSAFLDRINAVHLGPVERPLGADATTAASVNDRNGQGPGHSTSSEPARLRLVTNDPTGSRSAERWARQTQADGRWDDVQLVDGDDADYTVVIDAAGTGEPADDAMIDPARTIVVQTASPATVEALGDRADPDRRAFIQVRTRARYPDPIEWHLGWDLAAALTEPITKTRTLSAVVSGNHEDVGQFRRLVFIHNLQAHHVPIDVFGRDNPLDIPRHLGPLPDDDKRRGILPYRYTFVAERRSAPNYFTEKVIDAALGEAVCFYWGCPNLEDHLDPRTFIRLPLESPDEARRVVMRAIADDEWSRRIEAIRVEKRRLVEEAQIVPTLARTIRGHRLAESLDIQVLNLDGQTDRWSAFQSRLADAAGDRWSSRAIRRSAVAGADLQPDDELRRTFRGGSQEVPADVKAVALSHRDLWRSVVESGRPTLVFEDDATVVPDFGGQLVELCAWLADGPMDDVVLLGQSSWDEELEQSRRAPWLPTRPEPFEPSNFARGSFGYVVSPLGAERLLALVERDGFQQSIDWFLWSHAAELGLQSARPALAAATAEVGSDGGSADALAATDSAEPSDPAIESDLSTLP